VLLTINLLKQDFLTDEITITLIDRNPESDLGPAYSSNEECLLLNVPACRMGAFSAEPQHFLTWAQSKGIAATPWDFLPRKLYREYIQELLQRAISERKKNISLKRIQGEVTDIRVIEGKAEVFVNEKSFVADKVVLALGNFPPRNLPIENLSFLQSKRYVQNPWSEDLFQSLSPNDPVILIGTGQTTVDLLVRLHHQNHQGKIIALSRHGLFPLTHSSFEQYPSFYGEIKNHVHVVDILRVIRNHFTKAEKIGLDKNAVIDSLRPYTQELWFKLSLDEKRSFLRHLFRYFEIIRSRIPRENASIPNQMLSSGQLTIIKGRITDMVPASNHIEVHYLPHGNSEMKMETAALIINTIGPETDYTKVDSLLIKNLLRRGFIETDPLHLGLNAMPNGTVINSDAAANNIFYTLGFTMRGILWEILAAPEIRLQAEQLAPSLLLNT